MWGRVLDVINRAKFQLHRFRDLGPPGGRISLSPVDWRYRSYHSVRTNVLDCDYTTGRIIPFHALPDHKLICAFVVYTELVNLPFKV